MNRMFYMHYESRCKREGHLDPIWSGHLQKILVPEDVKPADCANNILREMTRHQNKVNRLQGINCSIQHRLVGLEEG